MPYIRNSTSVISMNQAENFYLLNSPTGRIFSDACLQQAQLESSCVKEVLYESVEDSDPFGNVDSAATFCRAGPRWSRGLYDSADVRRGHELRVVLVVGQDCFTDVRRPGNRRSTGPGFVCGGSSTGAAGPYSYATRLHYSARDAERVCDWAESPACGCGSDGRDYAPAGS